ncbi:MAG: DUF4249 domain-containing protein [Bacteroidetes bacterium]|nr:DUF4249 domain-containing protein [Bacteroidota bacterium]
MAREYWFFIVLSGTGWLMSACRKPYSPPAINNDARFLVVEGVIAAGQDSTIITLNRTIKISGINTANPESGATVVVEGDQGVKYTLTEGEKGRYAAPPLNLDHTHKYHLLIGTADGRKYASDYEPVKVTPPIDSLYYTINSTNDGLKIFTDTHDPANSTRYYRWDYKETYIYNSIVNSYFVFDPTQFADTLKSVLRKPDQYIHTCYITRHSTGVLLNSTAALSQDIIRGNQIIGIADTSEKILERYSILVKQYALTDDAYNFWYNIKRNTQQIGTIFDVQPSEVPGNIHCTSNPAEPVIGYVSVSTISQKRIFIDRTELPVWPYAAGTCNPYSICWLKGSPVDPDLQVGNVIPVGLIMPSLCDITGVPKPGYAVRVAYYFCADCRYHLHGVTQVPDFWK